MRQGMILSRCRYACSLVDVKHGIHLMPRFSFADPFHLHDIFHGQGSGYAFNPDVVRELIHSDEWYGDIVGPENVELWLECVEHGGHRMFNFTPT